MTEATPAATLVNGARAPAELFGAPDGQDADALTRRVKRRYWRLAKALHPDAGGGGAVAFQRLSALYREALRQIQAGTYGQDPRVLFRTRRGVYEVGPRPAWRGDAAAFYLGRGPGEQPGEGEPAYLKVARHPAANPHLAHERAVLGEIRTHPEAVEARDGAFFPAPLEAWRVAPSGERLGAVAVVAYRRLEGLLSLQDVRRLRPGGLGPRDMAWIFRRLLYALGRAHRVGWVHGATLPGHVLIEPDAHGLVLVDWKHATRAGERLRHVPPGARAFYPPEVTAREPATPATDLWMAAGLMAYTMGPTWPQKAPRALRAFLRGCLQSEPARRPQDAWALRDEFDDLIEGMWGPRRFHPLDLT